MKESHGDDAAVVLHGYDLFDVDGLGVDDCECGRRGEGLDPLPVLKDARYRVLARGRIDQ